MKPTRGATKIEGGTRGRLIRQVPMLLKDVSLSGCLVESESDLGVGSTGMLLVDLWGVPCRYPVRLSRVTERPGASPSVRIAGEFTWKTRPSADAVTRVIKEHDARPTARILKFERGPSKA